MTPATLTDEPITKAGIYSLSMDRYHRNPTVGESVSASGLVTIEQTTLAHYWYGSYHNPEYPPDKDTKAMAFGRWQHCFLLEGETSFFAMCAVMPEDFDGRTTEGKRWKLDHAGRELVPFKDFEKIKAMTAAIRANPTMARALTDGRPEVSLVWRDAPTGIWLKSRPDWLPNKPPVSWNYKTAVSINPAIFERQSANLGYPQSCALAAEGLREVLGWDRPAPALLLQEKDGPYVAAPAVIDDDALAWGALQNRRALDKLARAIERNEWPAYDGVLNIKLPAWAETKLQRRHEAGEFAGVDPARQEPIT